jgi:GxxExxY protein
VVIRSTYLFVEDCVVVEIKVGEAVQALHEAQFLPYLKLGGSKRGLLINFNAPVLKGGAGESYEWLSLTSAPLW